MRYFFITGTSRGIGKAVTELLLENSENRVVGFARTNTIEHPNYTHHTLDLNDLTAVKAFEFPALADADQIVLFNNAGTLGTLKQVEHIDPDDIIAAYNINLISPSIMINAFMKNYSSNDATKLIVNVSSGAAQNPYAGWSLYCASKAGLDMFTRVVELEQQEHPHKKIKTHAVAPGVVDTGMQTEIRSADKAHFVSLNKFVELKESGDLVSPQLVAKKFVELFNDPESVQETIVRFRY
jgi:benzil reductase ((S)-benzoin forming)